MSERSKLIEYINDNFTIDVSAIRVIDAVYDYLSKNCHSLVSDYLSNGKKVYYSSFIRDLIWILNDSCIDLSTGELIKKHVIDYEEGK